MDLFFLFVVLPAVIILLVIYGLDWLLRKAFGSRRGSKLGDEVEEFLRDREK